MRWLFLKNRKRPVTRVRALMISSRSALVRLGETHFSDRTTAPIHTNLSGHRYLSLLPVEKCSTWALHRGLPGSLTCFPFSLTLLLNGRRRRPTTLFFNSWRGWGTVWGIDWCKCWHFQIPNCKVWIKRTKWKFDRERFWNIKRKPHLTHGCDKRNIDWMFKVLTGICCYI